MRMLKTLIFLLKLKIYHLNVEIVLTKTNVSAVLLSYHESFPRLDENDTESVESLMEKVKALKDDDKALDEIVC